MTAGNLSHIHVYKPIIIQTPVATFDRDLKRLVPVGDPCSVAGEDIPEVPRDCVPCTYHPMFSQRIKKGFGLSEVSTLTPADASGLTVRSTDAGTHKIDGPTFKPFSKVQVEGKLGRGPFDCKEKFLVADASKEG